jgi:hypothetical protein
MAVDPKTGKPTDPGELVVRELISRFLSDDIVDEDGRPVPPPPADPRGVSPLRAAYGPWLAAQEVLRYAAEGRP